MSKRYPTKKYSDGILVRVIREEKGFSQKQLAEKLKISVYRLRKIEHDKEVLNDKLVKRIAKWVGVPEPLIGVSDKSKPDKGMFILLKKMFIDILRVVISGRKERKKRKKR